MLAEVMVFKYPFWVALLISIVCGIVGTLVYANRLTFLAGGISHAAYGGIGLGIFLGVHVMFTTLIYTIVASVIIGILSICNREKTDSIVGLLWAGGMAFGIILLDLTPGYHTDIMSYLFGSIMLVSFNSFIYMSILTSFILIMVLINYHKFVIISYDEEYAYTRGINVKNLYILMFILIGIAVVMMIQLVGIVLVIALLSIPPYLASFHSRSLKEMMIFSTIWCAIFNILGIYLAYVLNISSGAAIIAVGIVITIFFLLLRSIWMKGVCYMKKDKNKKEKSFFKGLFILW